MYKLLLHIHSSSNNQISNDFVIGLLISLISLGLAIVVLFLQLQIQANLNHTKFQRYLFVRESLCTQFKHLHNNVSVYLDPKIAHPIELSYNQKNLDEISKRSKINVDQTMNDITKFTEIYNTDMPIESIKKIISILNEYQDKLKLVESSKLSPEEDYNSMIERVQVHGIEFNKRLELSLPDKKYSNFNKIY